MASGGAPLFQRAAATGRKVAVVGAGPAGLTCAHQLALQGHEVVLFDARPKLGGLNEYGLASYKTPGDFANRKSTRLNSSHLVISYAVFCLKKKRAHQM